MSLKAIPFVDLEALPPGSEIRVLHRNGDFIRFSYLKSEGRQVDFTTKLRGTKAHWSSGKLIVPPPPRYEGVRLGISNSREEHSIYRMQDGRLILSSMSSEAGMAFLVVPFRERSEIVVELAPKPAGRACPAPAH